MKCSLYKSQHLIYHVFGCIYWSNKFESLISRSRSTLHKHLTAINFDSDVDVDAFFEHPNAAKNKKNKKKRLYRKFVPRVANAFQNEAEKKDDGHAADDIEIGEQQQIAAKNQLWLESDASQSTINSEQEELYSQAIGDVKQKADEEEKQILMESDASQDTITSEGGELYYTINSEENGVGKLGAVDEDGEQSLIASHDAGIETIHLEEGELESTFEEDEADKDEKYFLTESDVDEDTNSEEGDSDCTNDSQDDDEKEAEGTKMMQKKKPVKRCFCHIKVPTEEIEPKKLKMKDTTFTDFLKLFCFSSAVILTAFTAQQGYFFSDI